MQTQLAILVGEKKAKKLLSTVPASRLMSAPVSALIAAGLTEGEAKLVKAAVALGLAVLHAEAPKKLNDPEAVAAYLGDKALDWTETIWCVTVDAQLSPIGLHRIAGVNNPAACPLLGPAAIIRACLLDGAVGCFLAHNHPSGDPTPSRDDVRVTKEVGAALKMVGLDLMDHIVVAGARWSSVKDPGHTGDFTKLRMAV